MGRTSRLEAGGKEKKDYIQEEIAKGDHAGYRRVAHIGVKKENKGQEAMERNN